MGLTWAINWRGWKVGAAVAQVLSLARELIHAAGVAEKKKKKINWSSHRGSAMRDLSLVCDLHPSSWQCWILKPLCEARGGTRILMDASQICFH